MRTLEQILRSHFGYISSDFGPGPSDVSIDIRDGIVNPGTLPHRLDSEKAVPLSDIFRRGQYLSLIAPSTPGTRAKFRILSMNRNGLDAETPDGSAGFLPWEILALALTCAGSVEIATRECKIGPPFGSGKPIGRCLSAAEGGL